MFGQLRSTTCRKRTCHLAISLSLQLILLATAGEAVGERQLLQSQLVTQNCPPANQCSFHVLAIGDSLTRGTVPSSNSAHPYTIKLEELLKQKFSSRAVPRVTTAGRDYIGVFQQAKSPQGVNLNLTFLPFLRQQLQQAKNRGVSYQWVVIMVGINDLGDGNQTAAAIMPRLIQAYKAAMDAGANVVAVTPFPNRFVSRNSKNEQERRKLVTLMRQYVARQPQSSECSQPKVYLQQLPAESFDFWSIPEARVSRMQDDKLHLNPYGYDMLGGLIFNTISQHVPLRGCLCPV